MERDRADADGQIRTGSVVTVVLRLLSRHLERGELVGHGEVVATGAVADIRDQADLIRLATGVEARGREVPHSELEGTTR